MDPFTRHPPPLIPPEREHKHRPEQSTHRPCAIADRYPSFAYNSMLIPPLTTLPRRVKTSREQAAVMHTITGYSYFAYIRTMPSDQERGYLCAEFGGVGFLRMSTIRVTELMEFPDGVMFSVYVGFT